MGSTVKGALQLSATGGDRKCGHLLETAQPGFLAQKPDLTLLDVLPTRGPVAASHTGDGDSGGKR